MINEIKATNSEVGSTQEVTAEESKQSLTTNNDIEELKEVEVDAPKPVEPKKSLIQEQTPVTLTDTKKEELVANKTAAEAVKKADQLIEKPEEANAVAASQATSSQQAKQEAR